MENNSSKDIAVFTFARGSQLNTNIMESDSYRFVLGIINSMMTRNAGHRHSPCLEMWWPIGGTVTSPI